MLISFSKNLNNILKYYFSKHTHLYNLLCSGKKTVTSNFDVWILYQYWKANEILFHFDYKKLVKLKFLVD